MLGTRTWRHENRILWTKVLSALDYCDTYKVTKCYRFHSNVLSIGKYYGTIYNDYRDRNHKLRTRPARLVGCKAARWNVISIFNSNPKSLFALKSCLFWLVMILKSVQIINLLIKTHTYTCFYVEMENSNNYPHLLTCLFVYIFVSISLKKFSFVFKKVSRPSVTLSLVKV